MKHKAAAAMISFMAQPAFKEKVVEYTSEFLSHKGLPYETIMTPDLKDEWSDYVAEKLIIESRRRSQW